MILRAMLQRLYAALTTGPGLNARPHHSRQRIDVTELRHLQAGDPALMLSRLLAPQGQAVEFACASTSFRRPVYPEGEWSEEQKAAGAAQNWQDKILEKLRDITEDATDYYHDHGEHALFLGFPLLSLPPVTDRNGMRTNRVLAPVMLAPVHLRVRRGANPGLTLERAGERGELIQPNPALLAWIEQQTGATTENLFTDDEGEDPWREIAEAVALVSRAAGLQVPLEFTAATPLEPVGRTENLSTPALLPSAVLGLFPLVNPGLLRDTQWMIEQEPALATPVKAFLSADALVEPEPVSPAAPAAFNHADRAFRPRPQFGNELLVTHADPCQAEAVAYARQSAALVVHGPPGTGKSQTIANIIGDHLARGERVLFVCDKRTALDVVKYRLEGMGLDELCGVIHDPQSDRRPFYLRLRERLENLAEGRTVPDPARSLTSVNERLQLLHAELRGYFDCLHGTNGQQPSFHQLCGEWFDLKSREEQSCLKWKA